MIQITGTVAGCARGTFQVEAEVAGAKRAAQVEGLTIEVCGESRCFTFDVVDGIEKAEAIFLPGTAVTLTLEVA